MPKNVEWLLGAGAPSNKPKINSSELAYPTGKHGFVLKPKIDGLSLTFAINCKSEDSGGEDLTAGLKETILYVLKAEEESQFVQAAKVKKTPYKINCNIVLPGIDGVVLMQAAPSSNAAFLRFDLNPDKMGPSGVGAFRDCFNELLAPNFSYLDLVNLGKMTRVDVAVDVLGIPISELIFSINKSGKTIVYYGVDGSMETTYMGKKKGSSPFKLYNKTQEQLDNGVAPVFGDLPHIRIEATLKPMKALSKLAVIPNPFEQFTAYRLTGDAPPESPHNWIHFGDSCRQRSISGALEVIPPHIRVKYEASLEKSKTSIWKPQRIWEKWESVVSESGLLAAS